MQCNGLHKLAYMFQAIKSHLFVICTGGDQLIQSDSPYRDIYAILQVQLLHSNSSWCRSLIYHHRKD
jgi:hypothetical protein